MRTSLLVVAGFIPPIPCNTFERTFDTYFVVRPLGLYSGRSARCE